MGFRKRRYYQKGNLKIMNFFINLKSSNPKCMVYGGSGRYPLLLFVKIKMIM